MCLVCASPSIPGRLGYCYPHYKRFRRHGDPLAGRTAVGTSPSDRVAARPVLAWGNCLLWTGMLNRDGYGRVKVMGNEHRVHRVVFEASVGPLGEDDEVDHECHNAAALAGDCFGGPECLHRRCINPAHLRATTMGQNLSSSPHSALGGRRQTQSPTTGRFVPGR